MKRRIFIDTGPLIASLDSRDRRHEWMSSLLAGVEAPLFTCEAVITEACYLLRRTTVDPSAPLRSIGQGAISIDFRLENDIEAVTRLMTRYANVPMSLADACLVRMTELHTASTVLTFDSDFHVYRRNGRQVVPTLMPV